MKSLRDAVRVRLRRLTMVPFAVVIGLLGVNSAINLFLYPDRSPAHALTSPFDYLWAALYGIGGLMIVAGIACNRIDVEAAGCIAFAGGAIVNALAFMLLLGWPGWNTVIILGMFAVAAMIRGLHIIQGKVLIMVETREGALPTIVNTNGPNGHG